MDSAPVIVEASPAGSRSTVEASLLAAAERIVGFGIDPAVTLPWVAAVGAIAPLPGDDTIGLWQLLAATARVDVGAARMLEPHLDALAILAQARAEGVLADLARDDLETWGVFAAEGGGDAVRAAPHADGTWRLRGTKPWCSLAAHLDRALITAWTGEERGLFAIDLRTPEILARSGPWNARGLAGVVSAPVDLHDAPAVPVGGPGWYLRRPGFAWGGMGVAAVWHGAMTPLVETLVARAAREDRDPLAELSAGRADAAGWSASLALAEAARAVDAGITGPAATLLAARVRAVVAAAVREVLAVEARELGPGPVATDEAHARRVADLDLYVRQDHGDRDLARLGRRAAVRS
jgi:alkylation response protein AidB-like acyl-CoA dehydrogenase